MNDGVLELVQVLERLDNLHNDRFRLLLGNLRMLLQIDVQVVAFAVFQDRAKSTRQILGVFFLTTTASSQGR